MDPEEIKVDDVVVEESSSELPINSEAEKNYRIWKKNAPFLYDYLSTHTLLWPSLSVQFFPDLTTNSGSGEQTVLQRLLLGTFTLGQAIDSISIVQLSHYLNLNKNLQINRLDFNQEKEEFELSVPSINKINVLQKISHFGDVNKVQYMPQKPNVLASANNVGDLVIYERTKHSNFKNDLAPLSVANKVQMTLRGQSSDTNNEIFAIDWNKQREGVLVSGNMNGDLNVFDIKKYSSASDVLDQHQHIANGSGVNDIEWFSNHDSLFAVADETGSVRIYDTRSATSLVAKVQASESGINGISINKQNPTCFSTGDSRGSIVIWDIRYKELPYSTINKHKDSITQVKWHPRLSNIVASSSSDTTVQIFDVNKHEQDEGLLFVHAGHMLGVNDFDWSFHDDWLLSSVADDNSLHVWKPTLR
ncbi:WD40 repeat-like protein [Suhomyces tanzawaensis NRRL Y-17324]|uniref:WD40 repeat-like protein n=1 Tax=Suhomyces tanzawaensis NRRL Y-17324 TaxID=984487 RepID=A0A1E4SK77_9ASCO|nr:WD40 repeat-like protein [Suhomyces tanzawaensis NRRL Y-17324]ODV79837.1 WD40 repeat-like protein [Suhomyces tanzawaensis NRRL Y-17324]